MVVIKANSLCTTTIYYIATTHYKSTTLKKSPKIWGDARRRRSTKVSFLFLSVCLFFIFPLASRWLLVIIIHKEREREKRDKKNCRAHFFFYFFILLGLATWHDEEIDGLEKNIFWLVDSRAFTHAHMQSFRTSFLLHCWKFYSNWNTQTKHSHSSNGCGWTRSHSPHLSVCRPSFF